jgi:hypothetical protein
VQLEVEVATLFTGVQQAENYVAMFDSKELASGMYLYQMQARQISDGTQQIL